MKNSAAVTIEVRPVRPPSATPEEDSTKVVTVEVPQTAPQHVASGAGAVERAQRIEHIDHAERQHRGKEHDDEVAGAVLSNVRAEVEALGEDLAECLRAEILESAEEIGGQVGCDIGRIELGNGDEADGIVEHRTAEHAPQDSALDLLLGQRADDEHGDQRDEHREDCLPMWPHR